MSTGESEAQQAGREIASEQEHLPAQSIESLSGKRSMVSLRLTFVGRRLLRDEANRRGISQAAVVELLLRTLSEQSEQME